MLHQILACVSLGSFFLFCLFVFADDSSSSKYDYLVLKAHRTDVHPMKEKVLIYMGTTYFGKNFALIAKTILKNCPKDVQEFCSVSSNRSDISKADAILYHNRDFNINNYVNDSSKIHIMMTSESQHSESIRFEPGTINWTNTFKRDSGIFCPYGELQLLSQETRVDFESIWKMKIHNLTSTWMASNCKASNHRTELIKNARKKGLQLDIYGNCGIKLPNCGRYGHGYNCAINTLGRYKFYFAFENANCVDYLSEKFWNALHLYKAVPIVIQRNLLTDLAIPGNIFIALDDFSSMQEMVGFLNKLKDDKKRYLSYHEWRKYFKVGIDDKYGFCDMCNRLRIGKNAKPHVYEDLKGWFSAKTQCNNSYANKYLH